MESRDVLLLSLTIVSGLLVVSTDASSWDIAVSFDNQIVFLNRNGVPMGNFTVPNTEYISTLAYDPKNRTLYVADYHDNRDFSSIGNLTEGNLDIALHRSGPNEAQAIAYDPVTRTMFWVDSTHLMKMVVPSAEYPSEIIDSSPVLLHNLTIQPEVHGFALDICHRYIYWTTRNFPVHTIERSRLDGTDRREIFRSTVRSVHVLAIDHMAGKLYTVGLKVSNGLATIEVMNLEGTDRRVLLADRNYRPFHVAVDDNALYWTDVYDKAVWKMDKNGGSKRQIYEATTDLGSVLVRDAVDCEAVLENERNPPPVTSPPPITSGPSATMENLLAAFDQLSAKVDRLSQSVAELTANFTAIRQG